MNAGILLIKIKGAQIINAIIAAKNSTLLFQQKENIVLNIA